MTDGTVNITVDMTPEQRLEAINAVAAGARTVTMPADQKILDGRGIKRGDLRHFKGSVTLRGVNGTLHAT